MAKKTTKAAANVAGKAKEVAKAVAGQPGILKHLAGEHAKASTIIKRIASSSEDSDAREELFPELRKELLAHARSEEKEFYPALRKHAELRDLVARSLEQHERIESKLDDLDKGDKHTATWTKEFDRLKRAVEEHVELEEKQIFPRAKELISKEQLERMLEPYEAREKALQKRIA